MPRIELKGPDELNVKDRDLFILIVSGTWYQLSKEERAAMREILNKYQPLEESRQ